MSNRSDVFVEDNFYHLYNRGNEKKDIFNQEADYSKFVDKMEEYSRQEGVEIIAYCLMKNHFHVIAKQQTNGSITRFMHRLCTSYSMFFNKKYGRVGHLFQGRFKSRMIDTDEYLLQLSRYVHLNPEKLTNNVIDYNWSSLSTYLNKREQKFIDRSYIFDYFPVKQKVKAYKEFLFSKQEKKSFVP